MLWLAGAVLVGMQGLPAAAADTSTGLLRIAHLSPDTPGMDVALAPLPADGSGPLTAVGSDLATGLTYGLVSGYTELAPGGYAVSLRPAGSAPSTPPSLTARVDVPAGAARTVAVSGLFADLALRTLSDDLSAPPAGTARVRVVSAAPAAGPVDVAVPGGPTLATNLAPGTAGDPVGVPAGPAGVVVDGAAPVTLDWPSGSVSTLLVLDTPGGLTVRSVLDAAGPAVTPTGAVEAGGGGTAAPSGPLVWLVGAAVLLASFSRRGRVLAVVSAAVVTAAPYAAASRAPSPPVVTLSPDARVPAAVPVRLQVPAAGIDTTLAALDLGDAGALVPPPDDSVAGWYRGGPAPGDTGPAVVTGHVDSSAGPAVFFRLRQVAAGDAVVVTRADGTTVPFTVTRVARYPKTAFPAGEVYAPTPGAELRLITCGGAFDRTARSYLDDVVVYAALR